jgi:hypothetical protein
MEEKYGLAKMKKAGRVEQEMRFLDRINRIDGKRGQRNRDKA